LLVKKESVIRVSDHKQVGTTISGEDSQLKEIPYGIKMLGASKEWKEVEGGEGVKVAVLDTGAPDHPDISSRARDSKDFVRGAHSKDVYDHQGHHTHVAGTIVANGRIKGVVPNAMLYNAKVLDDRGMGDDLWIAEGVEWALSQDVDVINMSLGGYGEFPKTHRAIKKAVKNGTIVVAAAGNHGQFGVTYPACYDEVIAVAAVNIEVERPDFSAVGNEVEVAAAGYEVLSTWLGGQYMRLEGTSMAAPAISGAIAIMQAKARIRYGRRLSLDEIRLLLHLMAKPVKDVGRTLGKGYGVFSFTHFDPEDVYEYRKRESGILAKIFKR